MKYVKGQPITGAGTEMRGRPVISKIGRDAQRRVNQPPAPFTQPFKLSTPNAPSAGSFMPVKTSAMSGVKNSKAPAYPMMGATGGGMPGHNSQVVGGRKGRSHPRKVGASPSQPRKRGAAFYGE